MLDFFPKWLADFSDEDIELVVGQVVYGLIMGELFQQHGMLVKYFVREVPDDSLDVNQSLKRLAEIDDLFTCCHANLKSIESALGPYMGLEVDIHGVLYDRSSQAVMFTISSARETSHSERCSSVSRVRRERRAY